MPKTVKKFGQLMLVGAVGLGVSGCCEDCKKEIMARVKVALNVLIGSHRTCCEIPADRAVDCVREQNRITGQLSGPLQEAVGACISDNREDLEDAFKELWDLIKPGVPIPSATMKNQVVQRPDGSMGNSLPFFWEGEWLTLFGSAETNGQWEKQTTTIVNGREVLPEAAGKAAERDAAAGVAQPVTHMLLKNSPDALSFLKYEVDKGTPVVYASDLGQHTVEMEGEFSVSTYKQAPNGHVVAFPGEAVLTLSDDSGTIILTLDRTQPENYVLVDQNNLGVLGAEFDVKGTGDYAFVSTLYPDVWLELPLTVDPQTMALSFSARGVNDAPDVMPGSASPGTNVVPCEDPAPDMPQACRCVDSDGDGVPDMRWIEWNLRNVIRDIENDLCNDEDEAIR